MLHFIVRRTIYCLCVLFVVSILTFLMLRLAPGGPFDADRVLDGKINSQLLAKYRLDKPLLSQYGSYMKAILLHGDLGPSFTKPDSSVNEILRDRIPVSFTIGISALVLALIIGITAGVIAVIYRNTSLDAAVMACAVIGLAVPNFVLAPLLLYFFALKLHVVGIAFRGNMATAVLPVLVLALPLIAKVARIVRAGLADVIQSDFMRTARAKGLSEPAAVVRHGLRIALLPVVSFLGPASAAVMTGTIVVERIFSIDGLGNCFFGAALDRDYTVVMGLVLLYSSLLVIFNFAVDIAYGFLDPRVRIQG